MCLLLGSRSPGRGCGWYCESEEELEKVFDLRFVLSQAKLLDECRLVEYILKTNKKYLMLLKST